MESYISQSLDFFVVNDFQIPIINIYSKTREHEVKVKTREFVLSCPQTCFTSKTSLS